MGKEITFDKFIRWAGVTLIVLAVLYMTNYLSSQERKGAHRGGDTQGIEERGQVQGNEEPFLRFDVHRRQYRGENA